MCLCNVLFLLMETVKILKRTYHAQYSYKLLQSHFCVEPDNNGILRPILILIFESLKLIKMYCQLIGFLMSTHNINKNMLSRIL